MRRMRSSSQWRYCFGRLSIRNPGKCRDSVTYLPAL